MLRVSNKAPVYLAALVFLAAPAPSASADTGATIIERCTHHQSLTGFSQQAYRQALAEMPAEVTEYSECGALIRKAELAAARGGAGTGSGGGPGGLAGTVAPPSAAEQQTLQAANGPSGAAPVNVGGQAVVPGVVHADIASAISSLPTPLLAVLVALLAGAVALAVRAIRGRVSAHRNG
jgi:cobalamin biosynthesis Mg chelatase CobN